LNSGVNVVEIGSDNVITGPLDLENGTPTPYKLAIFNCNSITCKETYGYLYINNNYYYVSSSGSNIATTGTGIGEMNSSYQIILDNVPTKKSFTTDGSITNYLLKGNAVDNNVFGADTTAASEVITISDHYMILNNLGIPLLSCGEITSISCDISNLNTFCTKVYSTSVYLYEQKENSCVKMKASKGNYYVFKQKAEKAYITQANIGDNVIFSRELGTTENHIVFLGETNDTFIQQEYISIINNNKILDCEKSGNCRIKETEGMYYIENKKKIFSHDGMIGSDPKEENVSGVFYFKENIYRCKLNGCGKETIISTASTGNFNYASGKIQVYYNNDWQDVTNNENDSFYKYVEASLANLLINDNNKILMKINKTYAIKGKQHN